MGSGAELICGGYHRADVMDVSGSSDRSDVIPLGAMMASAPTNRIAGALLYKRLFTGHISKNFWLSLRPVHRFSVF